jgi:hypothetical protein
VSRESLPADVQRFLKEHIGSVGELEVLLLLHRSPARYWTAEAVNEELRTSLQSAIECLIRLHGSALAEPHEDERRGYRLAPGLAGEDTLVGRLAQLFKERVSSVIDAIYAPKHDNLREFADAFRLIKKKGDEDG